MANLLEKTVPRYTSYPTAPNFSAAVNADVYRNWLGDLGREATLSLYLHVPFCRELCNYCGCHTKATMRDEPITTYAQHLIKEIALVAEHTGDRKVTHIHWGGGTPSILGGDFLKSIADELARCFDLSAIHEHAIELDPRYLTVPLARALRDMGVNRASLGVQDFNPHVQQAVGRIQPFAIVKTTVDRLHDVGIDRINLDLMYGLPKQSVDDVRQTATLAHSLQPQRVAVFGYAHVPWFRPQQRLIADSDLPNSQERLAQAETTHRTLVQFGYQPIGLDHYARPDDELAPAAKTGRMARNFQGYTDDDADALVGLGASSIGRLPQGFAQNQPAVGNYMRAVAAGKLATVRGIALSTDDRVRGHIIERLMCDLAVDLDAVTSESGFDIGTDFSEELDSLQPYTESGALVIDGRRLRITEKGRPYMRLVASVFDSYLNKTRSRHSVAV
jgi:oxygen-independent coproporphyrinogen III oxidase